MRSSFKWSTINLNLINKLKYKKNITLSSGSTKILPLRKILYKKNSVSLHNGKQNVIVKTIPLPFDNFFYYKQVSFGNFVFKKKHCIFKSKKKK